MMRRHRLQITFVCFLANLRCTCSRSWTDAVDPSVLLDDGMPRVSPPRNKTKDYESILNSNRNARSHMKAEHIEIEMHGATTTLFAEVDPFRITSEPSSAPSYSPSAAPSSSPSSQPTSFPSASPTTSVQPTKAPTDVPTKQPTAAPTFSIAAEPRSPKPGYFNYDPRSSYGPNKWKNINKIAKDDPGYFWHTFDLGGDTDNDCGSGKKQSPIDVCVKPRESCAETHEMRPKVSDKCTYHFEC